MMQQNLPGVDTPKPEATSTERLFSIETRLAKVESDMGQLKSIDDRLARLEEVVPGKKAIIVLTIAIFARVLGLDLTDLVGVL